MRPHFAICFASLVACADDTQPGVGANLGVAGASCVRTPDCAAPLQCIDLVCRAADTGGADATADGTGASDAYTIDGTNPYENEVTPDIVTAYDVNDWEFLADTTDPTSAPDTTTGDTVNPFEDCGELGIASAWAGTFVGEIEYSVTPNPLTPSEGTLPVNGSLAFDITCIESKFIVRGTMDGIATVVGQGDFPFELSIFGTYDPVDGELVAKMQDGSVSIYGLIIVYFEGDFLGDLVDDQFVGEWSGESTGTNQEFITGTAEGQGLWGASPE